MTFGLESAVENPDMTAAAASAAKLLGVAHQVKDRTTGQALDQTGETERAV